MPTYKIDIPGQGSFDVESPTDLTDEQAYQYALQGGGGQQQPEGPQPGYFERTFSGPKKEGITEEFANITGRRVGSALDALTDIPSSLWGMVAGNAPQIKPEGDRGPLDMAVASFLGWPRVQSTMRLLQGVGAPVNILTAPVEAAGEQAIEGLTGSEQYGRFAGDITGAAGSLGLGLLAKSGKLGGMALKAAEVIAGTGAPKTYDEMIARDPHFRFVVERGEPELPRTQAEELARRPTSISELALELKRPNLAEAALRQKQLDNEAWREWAKTNRIVDDIPDEPRLETNGGKTVFVADDHADINPFETMGTPAARAMAKDPRAGAAALEMNLKETEYKAAVNNREARTAQAFTGVGHEDVRKAAIARVAMNHEDAMALPEGRLSSGVKRVMQFFQDKFEVDRQIALPRMREQIRPSIERQVERDMDWASDQAKAAEVERRVLKAIPDNWKMDENALHIFPGFYRIMDKEGNPLETASTGMEWKIKVNDLAKARGMKPEDFVIEAQAVFDADLLHNYKGRTKRSFDDLANAMTPTRNEIEAAVKGEYWVTKPFNLFRAMGDKNGRGSGYADELKGFLNSYDRGFERWLQITDLEKKINPILKEVGKRYPKLAEDLKGNMKALWGHRMAGSAYFDNLIHGTPVLRDVVAPYAMERWLRGTQNLYIAGALKYRPSFQAVNATQIAATLWPIADASEIFQGIKLRADAVGEGILSRHDITGSHLSKIEGYSKSIGITEKFNQEVAFLTMYNRARKLGLSDAQAANYGKLRGNMYSQFMGLTTDKPIAFRKLDKYSGALGMATMFQRFPIKQAEMLIDLIKDKNFPGAAKWLGVNLVLGGFKAATLGNAGWLTYKLYKDIEQQYGKPVADVFHVGLPAMLGVDISNSVMVYNPPFGENWAERLGNLAIGPIGGLAYSVIGQALNEASVEPSAAKRAYNAFLQKMPLARIPQGVIKLVTGDYDFDDPQGRLRYKGDVSDIFQWTLGFRTAGGTMAQTEGPGMMKEAEVDTFASALMGMRMSRDSVINYAASRYGQAMLSGVDLGKDMEDMIKHEVDNWNKMWPEFPITGSELLERAQSRRDSAMRGLGERLLKNAPAAFRRGRTFMPSAQPESSELPFEFNMPPGGG